MNDIHSTTSELLKKLLYTFLLLINITAFGQIRPIHEETLDQGISADPFSIVPANDGGFFLALQSTPSPVSKLDAKGKVLWRFNGPSSIEYLEIKMITALPDGGLIVCGSRGSGGANFKMLPGFVIRLDPSGREIARLDPGAPNFKGRIFYDVMTCVPWGDGFAISVIESVNDEATTNFNPYTDGRTAVKRLDSNLSLKWSKPLKVGGPGWPTHINPLELPSGDLVFPSGQGIYILNATGIVLAEAPMKNCRWVRSVSKTRRLTFVCLGDSLASPATVVEYDESLQIKKRTELIGSLGLPIVAETDDEGYLAALNGSNSKGPDITKFDSSGNNTGRFSFSQGSLQDMAPTPKGTRQVAILRSVISKGHFAPNISWLSY
jgi:hypothetical protein